MMKIIISLLLCVVVNANSFCQSVTLLYRGPSGWNNANSWIQINTPVGQTPISRVPLFSDDVVFSMAMSGVTNFTLDGDVNIGAGPGSLCRSMRLYNTHFFFINNSATDRAALINVYTGNGGYFVADSGSNIQRGLFILHGGNPAIIDLQVINSSYGEVFTHADWSGINLTNNARARFINSNLGGNYFINEAADARIYADGCEITTPLFSIGALTTDSIFNSHIKSGSQFVTLQFTIGPGANFVSSNLTVSALFSLYLATSGSTLNGNVFIEYPGYLYLGQMESGSPLPNIINGNITTGETYGIYIDGDLKISGNINFNTPLEALNNDTATVFVNGQPIFIAGGISYLVNNPSRIEFFGNGNSEIKWPAGFPIDTLILNKTGCGKLSLQNSLYVVGKTKINNGQLVLNPNPGIPFKFVCLGDLELMPGGGIFLRRNAQNQVAGMAIQGDIIDNNPVADSTCTGISNPYGGDITLYRNLSNNGDNIISINHPQGLPNLQLAGKPGSGFILAKPLTVSGPFRMQAGELNLNQQPLTVKPW